MTDVLLCIAVWFVVLAVAYTVYWKICEHQWRKKQNGLSKYRKGI